MPDRENNLIRLKKSLQSPLHPVLRVCKIFFNEGTELGIALHEREVMLLTQFLS
ncbi:hypothetical protein JQ628_23305 [Bradyrhizobium lablabi]|uniref:hypothetical protein n=1 Tax=Bradyrhizobium lablabi TaxID=722472 RepID=UPI001BAB0B5E|nr:hypothetical protein [Bradyrhizobium lablabi]MBR1124473.1 hypothetical protein [Bradyrhizobium lablabi]